MPPRHPLVLIRHGQPEHHVSDLTGGWTDDRLTPLGRHQASLLANRLTEELSGRALPLITSDLQRARETAEIIGAALNAVPKIEPDLREHNNGVAAGLTHTEAHKLQRPLDNDPVNWRPYPGSETWKEFYSRIALFLEHLTETQEGPCILVCHSGAIQNAIVWWLGLAFETGRRPWSGFDVHPTSISVLRVNHMGESILERLNDTAHLYAEGLTPPLNLTSPPPDVV